MTYPQHVGCIESVRSLPFLLKSRVGGQSFNKHLKKGQPSRTGHRTNFKKVIGLLGQDRSLAKYQHRNQSTNALPSQNLAKFRRLYREAPAYRFNVRKTTHKLFITLLEGLGPPRRRMLPHGRTLLLNFFLNFTKI